MRRKPLLFRLFSYAALFVAAMAFYRVSVHDNFMQLRESWERERELKAKIEQLREENVRIERYIEDLEPDGSEIERIAREELRWARPEETVIDVPEKR